MGHDEKIDADDTGAEAQSTQPVAAKTQWHQLLGTLFDLLLTAQGVTVLTEPQVMSEPPKVDIVLLRQEGERWMVNQLQFLPDGLRDVIVRHVLVEFKYTESLSEASLRQIVGYDYFYEQSKAPRRELKSFIMSARTPRKSFLQRYGYAVTETPGIYVSSQPLLAQIPIIVLNELRDEPHNAFVQCFASRRRIRERAFRRLQEMDWRMLSEAFWDFMIGLESQMMPRGGNMEKVLTQEGLTPEMVMSIGKKMREALLNTMTPEERLAGLDPKERLAGLDPKERLAGLDPKERLAGLDPEERLAGLSADELARLMAHIETFLHQHPGNQQPPDDKGHKADQDSQ